MYGFSFTWNHHHHTYYKMAPIGSSVLSPHEIPAYSASLQIHENLGQQLFLLYMHGLERCTVCKKLKKLYNYVFLNSKKEKVWTVLGQQQYRSTHLI